MPNAYLVCKSVIMLFLIVSALTFFIIRTRRLLRLMKAVEGTGPSFHAHWGKRFSLLFTDILWQKNVRRKRGIGLAHMGILFGFLAVQPHSLTTMVSAVIPAFDIGALAPHSWNFYLFVADILALITLISFAYVAYRRIVLKPSYLPLTTDALCIIGFTVSIIVTFQLLTAMEACLPGSHILSKSIPISGAIAAFLHMSSWPVQTLRVAYESAAWVHIVIILGFLVYIPGSKHLHLLAAVPNVLLKPLQAPKAIAVTDIEAEDAESFGLGNVLALHWKNVLDLYACTECGRCHEQCPAASTGKPLSPRNLIHDLKECLFQDAALLLNKTEDAAYTPLVGPEGKVFPDQLWACTSCRACENICPVNIQHYDFIIEARKYQVLMESSFPQELTPTFTNLENQSNPWGFPVTARTEWFAGLDVLPIQRLQEAEFVYYPGSALSLDDRGRKISQALIRVLNKAGVPVAVLGDEELDSGDDARRAGNEYLAQTLIRSVVELLQANGVKRLLTACPHTFNILKNEYPQFGGNFEVWHHTEYLAQLLQTGRITVADKGSVAMTFHDSCYLGRWNNIYDAPRQIIAFCNAGCGPVEPERHRDLSFCCGGGGARMFMEENIGDRINVVRCKELQATGAQVLLASCPYCITMLTDAVKELNWQVPVLDPVELLAERLC